MPLKLKRCYLALTITSLSLVISFLFQNLHLLAVILVGDLSNSTDNWRIRKDLVPTLVSRINIKRYDPGSYDYSDNSNPRNAGTLTYKIEDPNYSGFQYKRELRGRCDIANGGTLEILTSNASGIFSQVAALKSGTNNFSIPIGQSDGIKIRLLGGKDGGWTNLYTLTVKAGPLTAADFHIYGISLPFFKSWLLCTALLALFLVIHSLWLRKYFAFSKERANRLSLSILIWTTLSFLIPLLLNLLIDWMNLTPIEETFSISGIRIQVAFFFFLGSLVIYHFFFLSQAERTKVSKKTQDRLFFFLFVLVEIFAATFFLNNSLSGDGSEYFSWLRSLVIDHDLNFKNESLVVLANGWRSAVYGIYPLRVLLPIAWAPGYLLAHILTILGHAVGAKSMVADGWSSLYVSSIVLTTIFFSSLGSILSYQILRLFFRPTHAYLAVAATCLGTPILTWTFVHPSYCHGLDFFISTAVFAFWLLKYQIQSIRSAFTLGLIIGLAAINREQNLIFLALPWVTSVLELCSLRALLTWPARRRATSFISTLSGTLIIILPILAVAKFYPETFALTQMGAISLVSLFRWETAYALLFSSVNGMITTTPLIGVGFVGAVIFLSRKSRFKSPAGVFAMGIVSIFSLQFLWMSNLVSAEFISFNLGQRLFINCTLLFAFGLASLLQLTSQKSSIRKLVQLMLAVGVIHFLLLNLQYQGHIMQYLGSGSDTLTIIRQQITAAWKLSGKVASEEIFWSVPKPASIFAGWQGIRSVQQLELVLGVAVMTILSARVARRFLFLKLKK